MKQWISDLAWATLLETKPNLLFQMWFQILRMTNLVRVLAPKFCDPFQSGCEMWAIATFSSRTVKDLSCHVTEIQETLCWKIPPKCFISIVSPNLFFGILVGANHFH